MHGFIRNWLTRPATPAEAARALSQAGHAQYRARIAATTERLQEDIQARRISKLPPRAEVVAGYRKERTA